MEDNNKTSTLTAFHTEYPHKSQTAPGLSSSSQAVSIYIMEILLDKIKVDMQYVTTSLNI